MVHCTSIVLKLNEVIDDLIENKKTNFNFYSYLIDEKISLEEIEIFNNSAFVDLIRMQAGEFESIIKTQDEYLKQSYPEYTEKELYRIKNFLNGLIDSSMEYEKIKREWNSNK